MSILKFLLIEHSNIPLFQDPFELIAERELVASVTVQCVACSIHDLAQNMTPFPYEPAKRIMWVDSMSRRRGVSFVLLW